MKRHVVNKCDESTKKNCWKCLDMKSKTITSNRWMEFCLFNRWKKWSMSRQCKWHGYKMMTVSNGYDESRIIFFSSFNVSKQLQCYEFDFSIHHHYALKQTIWWSMQPNQMARQSMRAKNHVNGFSGQWKCRHYLMK